MTDQNRIHPKVEEEAKRAAAELKAGQERAHDAKAESDKRMAEESGAITPETTKEQARPDTAAAHAQEQAEHARSHERANKKEALIKKAESHELDRELDASMDGSDPPSITQP